MVEERDFLKNSPIGIEPRQRIAFEGIGYAIAAIDLSYGRLRQNGHELSDVARGE